MSILQADRVTRYQRLRNVNFALNQRLVKSLSKNAIHEAGRKLGMMQRGVLFFNTEDETSLLMDYAIYDVREHGMNAIERMLAAAPGLTDSEEIRCLQGMRAARYSLFMVEAAEPGVGVHGQDLLRDESVFIVDINFSLSAKPGVVLAGRLITIDGITMTSGATLPVGVIPAAEKAEFVRCFVSPIKARLAANDSPQEWSEIAAWIIAGLVKVGASSRVHYRDPDEGIEEERPSATEQHRQWSRPLSKAERAKLNKRCPCGSGRKFRNCCGGLSKR